MRHHKIPDTHVGSEHLKNWMVKHLQMKTLSKVYLPEESFKHVGKKKVQMDWENAIDQIYLSFEDGTIITIEPYIAGIYLERVYE